MIIARSNDENCPTSSGQGALPTYSQISMEYKDYWLDVALQDSFPCSDPIASMRFE